MSCQKAEFLKQFHIKSDMYSCEPPINRTMFSTVRISLAGMRLITTARVLRSDLLDAHGARGKQPLQAPVRTPAGEKRMLNNYRGELPLAYSPNGGQLLAAVDSTQLSETGTRRYLPTVGRAAGPVFGRRSVGRVAHYKTDLWGTSTYQKANQDLSYSRSRAWTDEETRRLNEAVEQFGAEHAWQRIAIEVGDNRAAGDCRRHWEDARRSKSRCVGNLQRLL